MEYLVCPKCNSTKVHKAGFSWSGQNKRQRYCCQSCHRITLNPIIKDKAEANISEGLTSAYRRHGNDSTYL